MVSYSLSSAYASFGATPLSKLRALSAMAADGSMVMSCAPPYFVRSAPGVLRYEDKLTRTPDDVRGRTSPSVHVRANLTGKVTQFDGDHFIVDFMRPGEPDEVKPKRKRQRD